MEKNFNSFGSFFMNVTGSMTLNEEHYIGVSTSGNKDKVMIKSIRCSVEVVEPNQYGLGDKSPRLNFKWSVDYVNWNRSKGAWGVRSNYQTIDDEYVNNIIGAYHRGICEQLLVIRLEEKLTNGVAAIVKRVEELTK
jgi:hypothetical protein